ncbi:MAG: YcbK family protein [Brucellaceae bacterium]|nr:YcbK family protein [Brucellaceae bacterium]
MTGEAALPEGTPVVPTSRPDAEETTSTVKTAAAEQPAGETVQVAAAEAMPEPGAETAPGDTTQLAMQAPELPKVAPAADAPAPVTPQVEVAAATPPAEPAQIQQPDTARFAAQPVQPKRNAFLSNLFKSSTARPPKKVAARPAARSTKLALVDPEPVSTKRIITTTSPSPARASLSALPGVRGDELFEINHGDGSGDTSDIDVNETGGSYQVASAAGLARLAPNGLHTQRPGVEVECLKPELVRVLKSIERKYGRPVVVTSGYRNPNANRRAGGAKKSLHMYCAAADIQIEGVSKWALASYLRTMPGRGGVGTYCHTESVHIDIGPKRDWNWRCRRRK